MTRTRNQIPYENCPLLGQEIQRPNPKRPEKDETEKLVPSTHLELRGSHFRPQEMNHDGCVFLKSTSAIIDVCYKINNFPLRILSI